MAQKQIHQTPNHQVSQNFVYTINRMHDSGEWMLAAVDPRKWSKKDERALIFSSLQEAERCISAHFTSQERADIYVRRTRLGA